jgi:alpha-N-arabinofuranosidase
MMPKQGNNGLNNAFYAITALFAVALFFFAQPCWVCGAQVPSMQARIHVETGESTGQVPKYMFGQFIEHEHNTIDDGLLAEILHDRKFEEGDRDKHGVSAGWVPEERVADRYWEMRDGRGAQDRYSVDHTIYYGGGASQAIELSGDGSSHASVYQIGLQFAKGRSYSFYVYLRKHGAGKGFVEIDKLGGPVYLHKDFDVADDKWEKYTAEFTSPEDTRKGRLRIGFTGVGSFWMDSASLMPSDNIDGIRRDVIETLRPLRISVLRYPGGCFADYYNWKNGTGPRDQRPDLWSTIWHEWNSNDFGIDEYMTLARNLGYDGHITVNYSSGTEQDAAEWVQYANGSEDTPMGRLRAENGHPVPYGIKLWAVGNEAPNFCSEDYTGRSKLNDYVERFGKYEAAMKRVDPSIQIMASSVGQPEWVQKLLQAVRIEHLGVSIYTGTTGKTEAIADQKEFYQKVVGESVVFKEKLEANIASPGSLLPAKSFFAVTEFNSWWLPETKDPDFRLVNGLYFASAFNTFLRHAKDIFLTESCSLINVQGIVEVNPVAVKATPPYFAYVLYANHIGSEVLKTEIDVPPVPFDGRVPALDAIGTKSADGRTLYLAVVNRAREEGVTTRIKLAGWQPTGREFQVYELNGKTWDAFNPYGDIGNVNISHGTAELKADPDGEFSYQFPPHSVTVIEISGHSVVTHGF